jgi:hypothetical protein
MTGETETVTGIARGIGPAATIGAAAAPALLQIADTETETGIGTMITVAVIVL